MQQKYCAKASQLEKNGHLRDAERSVSYNYRHLCIYVHTYVYTQCCILQGVHTFVFKHMCSLYVVSGDPDQAINMYKNTQQYDHMIRLVKQYHEELLQETHLHLAQVGGGHTILQYYHACISYFVYIRMYIHIRTYTYSVAIPFI